MKDKPELPREITQPGSPVPSDPGSYSTRDESLSTVASSSSLDSAESSPVYNTVVIGSGPIGLMSAMSALEHCAKGEQIALVADRIEELGVRNQVLWIQEDVYSFMEKLVGPELMSKYQTDLSITEEINEDSLVASGYYITTGAFEKLFLDALTPYIDSGDVILIKSKKIGPETRPTEQIQFDLENRTIFIPALHGDEKTPLKFKYLVSADGAKRSVEKALGALQEEGDLRDGERVKHDMLNFDSTQEEIQHTQHVVVSYQLPKGSSPTACKEAKVNFGGTGPERMIKSIEQDGETVDMHIEPCPLSELETKFGWTSHARPYSQVYTTGDVVYIGAEMPSALAGSNKRELQREYATLLLRDWLPREYIETIRELPCDNTKFGEKKKMLSVSTFNLELGDVNRTVIPCGDMSKDGEEDDTGVIFIMGDARKNPLYTTGTGAQTGVREVMHFNSFLDRQSLPATVDAANPSLSSNLAMYHSEVRAILDHIGEVQDEWILGRNQKHLEAEANYILFQEKKSTISAFCECIHKLEAAVESLKASGYSPPFLLKVQKQFTSLREKYKKVFDCSDDEKNVICYDGVNIDAMLKEVAQIQFKYNIKHPNGEDKQLVIEDLAPDGTDPHTIGDCYKQLKQVVGQLVSKQSVVREDKPEIEPSSDQGPRL